MPASGAAAVAANAPTGTITNVLTWNGAVTTNAGLILNTVLATWTGTSTATSTSFPTMEPGLALSRPTPLPGQITNNKTWNVNDGAKYGINPQRFSATWTGNITSNAFIITNDGVWNGNIVGNTGMVTNNKTWTGTVSNANIFINSAGATLSGLLTNSGGIVSDGGALNGGANFTGGALFGTALRRRSRHGRRHFQPGNGTPAR